jgi:hypothetical protein
MDGGTPFAEVPARHELGRGISFASMAWSALMLERKGDSCGRSGRSRRPGILSCSGSSIRERGRACGGAEAVPIPRENMDLENFRVTVEVCKQETS